MNWNLDDICQVEKFEDLLEEISKDMGKLEKWWPKLEPEMSQKEFAKFIKEEQTLGQKMRRALYLPELMEATNQKNQKIRMMKSKAQETWLKLGTMSRKFDHWLKGLEVKGKKILDDKNAGRLFSSVEDLKYVLEYNRKAVKYSLKQREEEIIDNKDIYGNSVISDLRGIIEAEMVYKMGKKKIKTQAEILKHTHSKNSKTRREAYNSFFDEHKKNIDKLSIIYQSVVKNWDYEAKIRGYDSPIAVRNFSNHVSDKTVETLLKVCSEERKIFWKYFEYKAKMLRKKKLERYDLYAPIGKSRQNKYSFEESKKMVLEAYYEFDQEMGELAEKLFNENHIDPLPKKNKISGAFCATVGPEISPYVLLNHTGSVRDVSTMAHELGHAIHSLLANKHFPDSQHANLPLSETASTFGEMILFEKMMNEEKDKDIKNKMLSEKIADSYATIMRQNYFVKFEIDAHKLMTTGATAEDICKLYLNNLKEQFGRAVKIDPIFKYEWLYISHIYESPFYCYAYNFGELLSLSLYAEYKKRGKDFIDKIKEVLKTGGSKDPTEVLAGIGVNIESENFWKNGFKIIEYWIEGLGNV